MLVFFLYFGGVSEEEGVKCWVEWNVLIAFCVLRRRRKNIAAPQKSGIYSSLTKFKKKKVRSPTTGTAV
jgi:hypothetical protein